MPVFEKSKSELKDLYKTKIRNTLMRSNRGSDMLKLLFN